MRRLFSSLVLIAMCFTCVAHAAEKQQVNVTFLKPAAAKKVVADPALFASLQSDDIAAILGKQAPGKTLAKQRAYCRDAITKAVQPFTKMQKKAIGALLGQIIADMHGDYPLVTQSPWRLIKLDGQYYGGLSHTRGKCIVLPQQIVKMIVAMRQISAKVAILGPGDLFLHEKMHVVQRAHPKLFASLYTKVWHFTHANKIIDTPWMKQHHIANPDGLDTRWVRQVSIDSHKQWVWPLLVLDGSHHPPAIPEDFAMRAIWVTPDKEHAGTFKVVTKGDGTPKMQPLNELDAYAHLFGGSKNIYHPNEAAADMFAKLAILDNIAPAAGLKDAPSLPDTKPWTQFKRWCKAHLHRDTDDAS